MKSLTTLFTVLALLACVSVAEADHRRFRRAPAVVFFRAPPVRFVAPARFYAPPIQFVAPVQGFYGGQQFNAGCAQQFNSGYGVQQFNGGHNCGQLLQFRAY